MCPIPLVEESKSRNLEMNDIDKILDSYETL